jgi:hypothetical protein
MLEFPSGIATGNLQIHELIWLDSFQPTELLWRMNRLRKHNHGSAQRMQESRSDKVTCIRRIHEFLWRDCQTQILLLWDMQFRESDLHSHNPSISLTWLFPRNITSVRDEQSLEAWYLINLTDAGMSIREYDVHFLNPLTSLTWLSARNITSVRDEQPPKAAYPMNLTGAGISIR